MRTLRKIIDISLPLLGVAVILSAVLFVRDNLRTQIAFVGLGMVLIEVGVWKVAHKLLPNERKYLALRAEGDLIIKMVRQLNAAALAMKSIYAELHAKGSTRDSLDKLITFDEFHDLVGLEEKYALDAKYKSD